MVDGFDQGIGPKDLEAFCAECPIAEKPYVCNGVTRSRYLSECKIFGGDGGCSWKARYIAAYRKEAS